MKINKKFIYDNLTTIFYALIIAIIIRSLLFQPFYIPSSSMEPNLLVGDRLFVSKYTYGYSRHSFPFSPNFSDSRIMFKEPKRGDVIVFKTSYKNDDIFLIRMICKLLTSCKTDYIKRLIGLPGDNIQFIYGDLFINNAQVIKTKIKNFNSELNCGDNKCISFKEKLPGGVTHNTIYRKQNAYNKTIEFNVPKDHYFFLGDNRDNSSDSRYFGYVNKADLVGKARIIFFSTNKKKGNIFQIWKWFEIIQWNRFFNIIN
jgi:signal peptidase I